MPSSSSDAKSLWSFLQKKMEAGNEVALLCVAESWGSSPGRQGFKMAVSTDGELQGSIGGGIMEQKLVSLALQRLIEKQKGIWIKKQIHRKSSPKDQSGMICSGEQRVVICPIAGEHLEQIRQFAQGAVAKLGFKLSPKGFECLDTPVSSISFVYKDEQQWQYQESVQQGPRIYIIGAGHVGWALSRMMYNLGFWVSIMDDRPGLNTLEQNQSAHEKQIVDYTQIAGAIPEDESHFVVIMTFGYRSDKIVLQQLLNKRFCYLGMMGSEAKIAQLFAELQAEGYSKESLQNVYAPIGLPIYSKTPDEIAVSIAAEIIQLKNESLPTGSTRGQKEG